MPKKRFEHLESAVPPLPEQPDQRRRARFERVETAPPLQPEMRAEATASGRFRYIEIGHSDGPNHAPSDNGSRVRCPYCSELNRLDRGTCWACQGPLTRPSGREPKEALSIVLDGEVYGSDDADLPVDIVVLIARIRDQGYSDELEADWRSWRTVRASRRLRGRAEDRRLELFQRGAEWHLVLEGRLFRSNQKDLDPEIGTFFEFLDRRGCTPELMAFLRRPAVEATLQPEPTSHPPRMAIDFWQRVKDLAGGQSERTDPDKTARPTRRRRST